MLSVLLLFTAAIVSNIESVQQTLNIPLASAYSYAPISIEGLIWVRSITVVLLVVVHAVRHTQIAGPKVAIEEAPQHIPEVESEEQTTVTAITQEDVKQIPAPKGRKSDALARVQAYLVDHPNAKSKEVSIALFMSLPTASKWLAKARSL